MEHDDEQRQRRVYEIQLVTETMSKVIDAVVDFRIELAKMAGLKTGAEARRGVDRFPRKCDHVEMLLSTDG